MKKLYLAMMLIVTVMFTSVFYQSASNETESAANAVSLSPSSISSNMLFDLNSFDNPQSLFTNDLIPFAYADNAKPRFSSSTFDKQSGALTITFSEIIDVTPKSDVDLTKIHIRESRSSSGGVTLSEGELTTNTNSTTISFTLTTANRDAVVALTTPQLDIGAGAVKDLNGNEINRANNRSINIIDNTKPAISSIIYDKRTGILNMTFSEIIDVTPKSDVDLTKIHFTPPGVGSFHSLYANELVTNTDSTILSFNLSNVSQARINSINEPNAQINAGAVKDPSGNSIAATSNNRVTILDGDFPFISSASFDVDTGIFNVNVNEPIDATPKSNIDPTKFHIRESGSSSGGITLSVDELTTSADGNTVSFLLITANRNAVLALTNPQLDAESGAVKDLGQLPNPLRNDIDITITDSVKPILSSTTFDINTKVLTLNFSEPIDATPKSNIDATKIHIRASGSSSGGVTLSGAELTTATDGTTLSFTLSDSNQNSITGLTAPQIDIGAGAVRDLRTNQNDAAADQSLTIVDNTKPGLSSATYDQSAGTLTLTFSEPVDATPKENVDATKIHIRAAGSSSGGVTLSGAELTTATDSTTLSFTLSDSNQNSIAWLATPQIDIDAGVVRDLRTNQNDAATDKAISITNVLGPQITAPDSISIIQDRPFSLSDNASCKVNFARNNIALGSDTNQGSFSSNKSVDTSTIGSQTMG